MEKVKNDECERCGHKRSEHLHLNPTFSGEIKYKEGSCRNFIRRGKAVYGCTCSEFVQEANR